MSGPPALVVLAACGLPSCGVLVLFIPTALGVDVMTCCRPVTIGFICARRVLWGVATRAACGLGCNVGPVGFVAT